MRLEDVKDRIDAYFDSVTPDEIVRRFKVLGFEFERRFDQYEIALERRPDITTAGAADSLSGSDLFGEQDDYLSVTFHPPVEDAATPSGTPSYAMAA